MAGVLSNRYMAGGEIQLALRSFLQPQLETGQIDAALTDSLPFEMLDRVAQSHDDLSLANKPQAWIRLLLKTAAAIEADKGSEDDAINLYRLILYIDPEHKEAAFALGVLFHDLKKPKALIELYRSRIQSTANIGEKITLHLYIADVFENHLSESSSAFSELVRAARLDPQNLRIVEPLERLGRRANQDQEVAVVLGELLLHAPDPHIRSGLALRLAELCLSAFDAPDRALAYYRSALFDDGGDPERLKEIQDVFVETHRFVELARQFEEACRDRRTSPQRNRIERELVHLYQDDQENSQRSLMRLRQAIQLNPNDRSLLEEMAALTNSKQEYTIFAEALEVVIKQSQSPLLVHFAQRRLGRIYTRKLKQKDRAITVYQAMLKRHPGHLEILHSLAQLYFENQDAELALQTYRQILSIQADDLEARERCQELAERIST